MSITINVSQSTGGSYTATATNADGVNVAVSSSAADTLSLTVGGGVGPPGAGNVALAAGDGILITSTANVATINCTVEGVPESVLENLSNVLSGNATTGDVLAWNGTTWAADSNFATLTYVDNAVANLVDAAPGALDTLNELAAAIGDDANFSATITTSLAGKANLTHNHTSANITDFATAAAANAPIQTINNLTGDLTLAAGSNVTLDVNGSTLTFSASASGGSGVTSLDGGFFPRAGGLLSEAGDNITSESGDHITAEQQSNGAIIQLVRSNVAAAVPTSLADGELAINTQDAILFWSRPNGSIQSHQLGTSAGGGSYGSTLLFG